MNCKIYYKSQTGNTQLLAKRISDLLSCPMEVITLHSDIEDYDCIFVGFWTDKGDCDEDVQCFLKSLHNQKIFLFGTAGFGGQQSYFESILKRVQSHLEKSNQVIGTYMCQGKMPIGIKTRYQKMLEENPDDEHLIGMVDNFEKALNHPNEEDLKELEKIVLTTIKV